MKSLFVKLFLGFWLTSLVVAVTAHFITREIYERARGADRQDFVRAFRAQQTVAATAILSTRGDQALRDWLRPLSRHPGLAGRLKLVDATGRTLDGPPLRPESRSAFAARPAGAESFTRGRDTFVRLGAVAGDERWLAWHDRHGMPPPGAPLPFGPDWRLPPGLALTRLAVALALSALVCFVLARNFSAPVRALRAASAAVSRGELTVRVPEQVARRGDELGRLADDFNRMAVSIAQMVESRTQLLRDVSHELRSPLARLAVALALARRRGGDTDALDRIDEESARLDALIAQVLTLARLESPADVAPREPVDLAALLDGVVRDAAFESSGRRLTIDWTRPAPCHVHGEPNLLRSAFENVVRNAATHTPAGTQVRVSLVTVAEGFRVCVEDSGPGVPAAALATIFEPFARADAARTPGGGVGLGLAIARRAVTSHGGHIEARNLAGGGFAVCVELPRPPA